MAGHLGLGPGNRYHRRFAHGRLIDFLADQYSATKIADLRPSLDRRLDPVPTGPSAPARALRNLGFVPPSSIRLIRA